MKSKIGVKFAFLFIYLMLTKIPVSATNELGNYFIRNYLPDEYKGHAQNWALTQDKRGVIYIANNYGVIVFDGKNWDLIYAPNNSWVRSFSIDNNGIFYVGATSELGYLAIDAAGSRQFVSLLDKIPVSENKFSVVLNCHSTPQGTYFFAREKIFRWHEQAFTLVPGSSANCLGFYVNNQLWAADPKSGPALIEENRLRFLSFPDTIDQTVKLILPFPEKNSSLMVTSQGRFFICRIHDPVEESTFQEFDSKITDYLQKNDLYSGLAIHDNLYAFSTIRGGIILMNRHGELISIINKQCGLEDNSVWSMMVDREGNLWAGLNYGLAYIQINSPITKFNKLNGLDGIPLSVIRHQGRLYVGNFNGVFYLNDDPKAQKNVPRQFAQVINTKTNCFAFYSYGPLLFASGKEGYYQIIGDKGYLLKEGLAAMSFGKSKRFPHHIWIGTESGLIILRIEDFYANKAPPADKPVTVTSLNLPVFSAVKDMIVEIAEDNLGNLWLTSYYDGILQIKFHSNQITDASIIRYNKEDGLPNLNENIIYFYNNQLILTTSAGLYKAVPSRAQVGQKKDYQFVPNLDFGDQVFKEVKFIGFLKADAQGSYWVLSDSNLGIISKNQAGIWSWDNTPFRSIKNWFEDCLIEDDGIVWLCGVQSRSVFRFDQKKQKNYQHSYPALIAMVTGENSNIIFRGDYYDFAAKKNEYFTNSSMNQPQALKIKLPYNSNSLVFHYGAAFYEHGDDMMFSHILQGFDPQWSNWEKDSKAIYTNIPEGSYQFRVKARNIWDTESSTASYAFHIDPPWQRSWWMYPIYLVILIVFFYGGIRLNSKRLIMAKNRLEKIVTDRTFELLKRNREITEKNQEINTQKNKIQNYADELVQTNLQLTQTKDALWGEMQLAKKIQTVLLPKTPQIPGYEISAVMMPADEVGGDYYDVIEVKREWIVDSEQWLVEPEKAWKKDEDLCRGGACLHPNAKRDEEKDKESCRGGSCARPKDSGQSQRADPQHPNMGNHKGLPLQDLPLPSYWLSIGDVSGHGVSAGLVMMMVQTAIRTVLTTNPEFSPAQVLAGVNQVLQGNIEKMAEDKYMTITLMSVQENGHIIYSGLHQDLLVYRSLKKEVELINTRGMWLGIMDFSENNLPVDELVLNSKDVMLLYTDGITEAVDASFEMFSEEKLEKILKDNGDAPLSEIQSAILSVLKNYTCHDDITLVIAKKLP